MEDEAEGEGAAGAGPKSFDVESHAGAVTDFVEIRVPGGEGADSLLNLAFELEAETVDTSGELLEELEPLPEVHPLPPEPVEEGLELLPAAEEERPADMDGDGSFGPGHSEALESRIVEPEEYEERARIERPVQSLMRQDVMPRVQTGTEQRKSGAEGSAGRSAPSARSLSQGASASDLSEAPAPNPLKTGTLGAAEEVLLEDVADFEELESVEEEPPKSVPAAAPALTAADTPQALEDLLASGAITSWTVEELQKLLEEGKSAIVMEDGLYRIKDEVYTAGSKPREGRDEEKLRQIVEEVVKHEMEGELNDVRTGDVEPAAEARMGSIGDLISAEDTFDLSDAILTDQEASTEQVAACAAGHGHPDPSEEERARL